jgi:hypothetical protein
MAARRLIPLFDRVLVEKITPAAKSVGGVLLPDSAVSKVGTPTPLTPDIPSVSRVTVV